MPYGINALRKQEKNPKSEASAYGGLKSTKHKTLNPKQIQMTKIQNSKRNVLDIWYLDFDIVSN